ncbi:MAG: hypothetical protein JNM28_01715 [Armatimonadetes bacterium]|nr:hypothetical protein [Armatimonadota bacterium]
MDPLGIVVFGIVAALFLFGAVFAVPKAKERMAELEKRQLDIAGLARAAGYRFEKNEKGDIDWVMSNGDWQLEYDSDRSSESSSPCLRFKSTRKVPKDRQFIVLSDFSHKSLTNPTARKLLGGFCKTLDRYGIKGSNFPIDDLLALIDRGNIHLLTHTNREALKVAAYSAKAAADIKNGDVVGHVAALFRQESTTVQEALPRILALETGVEVKSYVSHPTSDQVKNILAAGESILRYAA